MKKKHLFLFSLSFMLLGFSPCWAENSTFSGFSIRAVPKPGQSTDNFELLSHDLGNPPQVWVGQNPLLQGSAFDSATVRVTDGLSDDAVKQWIAQIKKAQPDLQISDDYIADLKLTKGAVEVKPTSDGSKALFQVTQSNIGQTLAIVLNGRVLAVPRVAEAVNNLSIGDFKRDEAEKIAQEINAALSK